MTLLPACTDKKLGLSIDLDICVGCQACVTSCKEWNTGGYSAPLSDHDPYGADPSGAWLNRVHSYEVSEPGWARTLHFPRSCLHCEDAACVTVCPTGASYKRVEDGIVLVNPDTCIGCKLCSWACPYGAREYDHDDGVMKKCTLCVDRIYNDTIPEEDRIPACVRACPTGARAFGDFADPDSAVSRAAEELAAARAEGIPVEIVPGVTAASAAAAGLGRPLTERGVSDTLILTTGTGRAEDPLPDCVRSVGPGTTTVFYMAVGQAGRIATALVARGLPPQSPVEVAAKVSKPGERYITATAATLSETLATHGITGCAVLFVTWPASPVRLVPALPQPDALARPA